MIRSPTCLRNRDRYKGAPSCSKSLDKARAAISRSNVFIVMLGSKTRNAPGVLKEVRIASELKKEKFQIIDKDGSENWAVPDAGRVYRWNWDNLKNLLK